MRKKKPREEGERRKWRLGPVVVIVCLVAVFGVAELRGLAREAQRGDFSPAVYSELLGRMDTTADRIRHKMAASGPALELGAVPVPKAEMTLAPVESMADRVSALRLDGVAWNEVAPVAFINGDLTMVDSVIDGLRVTAIEEERVQFIDEEGKTADILLYEKPPTEGRGDAG